MQKSERFKRISPQIGRLRLLWGLIAIAALVAGLMRGEALKVMQRAIQICLGCIGIG